MLALNEGEKYQFQNRLIILNSCFFALYYNYHNIIMNYEKI